MTHIPTRIAVQAAQELARVFDGVSTRGSRRPSAGKGWLQFSVTLDSERADVADATKAASLALAERAKAGGLRRFVRLPLPKTMECAHGLAPGGLCVRAVAVWDPGGAVEMEDGSIVSWSEGVRYRLDVGGYP